MIMLRFLIQKLVFDDMVEVVMKNYSSDITEDVNDMNKFIKCLQNRDTKNFTSLISYSYHLFEKNLLKYFKIAFDKHAKDLTLDRNQFLGEDDIKLEVIKKKDSKTLFFKEDQLNEEYHDEKPKEEDFL